MKSTDREIRNSAVVAHDNLEEFRDPANYDREEAPLSGPRIAFYCDLAVDVGGPVLELGCGTGLVAIPIAKRGLDVTGVDLAWPMLDFARMKARQERVSVNWIQADARRPALGKEFQLIYMTGNAFQAFLYRRDQESLLRSVRHCLTEKGKFAFEIRNPSGHELASYREEEDWFAYRNVEGRAVRVSGIQHFDAVGQIMHWTTFRRWNDDQGPQTRETHIACRFFYPQELAALLRCNGFKIVQQYGNWKKEPLAENSSTIISICARADD